MASIHLNYVVYIVCIYMHMCNKNVSHTNMMYH